MLKVFIGFFSPDKIRERRRKVTQGHFGIVKSVRVEAKDETARRGIRRFEEPKKGLRHENDKFKTV